MKIYILFEQKIYPVKEKRWYSTNLHPACQMRVRAIGTNALTVFRKNQPQNQIFFSNECEEIIKPNPVLPILHLSTRC